jgi:hypothetical protein
MRNAHQKAAGTTEKSDIRQCRRPWQLCWIRTRRRRAAAPALANFEQNAQRIGIHVSGDNRDVQRLLLT